MIDYSGCTLSCITQETILHVLRDCLCAKEVWLKTLSSGSRDSFFATNFEEWLQLSSDGYFHFGVAGSSDSIYFLFSVG